MQFWERARVRDLDAESRMAKKLRERFVDATAHYVPNLLNMASKPRWCTHMARTRRRRFGNIVGHVKGVSDMSSLDSWTRDQFDPAMSWADVEWVRKRWDGKLILKGVLDSVDAPRAADAGADVVVVSNHGGRQLDGALSSTEALPANSTPPWRCAGTQISRLWMPKFCRPGFSALTRPLHRGVKPWT